MPSAAFDHYLKRLSDAPPGSRHVWLDAAGRAQGRYFNCTLTSAFQPVRMLDSTLVSGFEAFARSYSDNDPGLSLWRLLDHAASDAESIELDRLCRMLHAINFYRQPEAAYADLYLSVHDRLLAAVDTHHGIAFRHILEGLGLPIGQIVLQLPSVTVNQRWLLSTVVDNYRHNGFRTALNAIDATQALALLERVKPDIVKVDAREIRDQAATLQLLRDARKREVRIVFKRVEHIKTLEILRELGRQSEQVIYAQGHLWDAPQPTLNTVGVLAIEPERSVV